MKRKQGAETYENMVKQCPEIVKDYEQLIVGRSLEHEKRAHWKKFICVGGEWCRHMLVKLDKSYYHKDYPCRQRKPSTIFCFVDEDDVLWFPPKSALPRPLWENMCKTLHIPSEICSADTGYQHWIECVDEMWNLFAFFLVFRTTKEKQIEFSKGIQETYGAKTDKNLKILVEVRKRQPISKNVHIDAAFGTVQKAIPFMHPCLTLRSYGQSVGTEQFHASLGKIDNAMGFQLVDSVFKHRTYNYLTNKGTKSKADVTGELSVSRGANDNAFQRNVQETLNVSLSLCEKDGVQNVYDSLNFSFKRYKIITEDYLTKKGN